jgi:hypothetical protein
MVQAHPRIFREALASLNRQKKRAILLTRQHSIATMEIQHNQMVLHRHYHQALPLRTLFSSMWIWILRVSRLLRLRLRLGLVAMVGVLLWLVLLGGIQVWGALVMLLRLLGAGDPKDEEVDMALGL